MAKALSLILVHATLAQSAEQTLRKRQVKGSNPLGGLRDIGGPNRKALGPLHMVHSTGMHHNG